MVLEDADGSALKFRILCTASAGRPALEKITIRGGDPGGINNGDGLLLLRRHLGDAFEHAQVRPHMWWLKIVVRRSVSGIVIPFLVD